MKPAVLRPQALRDQQGEVRYYRKEGGSRLALRVAKATNEALDQIELEPGMGSPTLGKLLGIAGLRTWRVGKFPLLWCYFERGDCLDVVRLLGERQDIIAILDHELGSTPPLAPKRRPPARTPDRAPTRRTIRLGRRAGRDRNRRCAGNP